MVAFNGSGTYNLPAGNPVVTGTTISSTWANSTLSDVATALTNCVTRDGQSPPTANLPMGSYKITGLGQASSSGDALAWGKNANVTGLVVGTLAGLLKATAGTVSAATSGTDYAPATSGSAILKGNGLGGFSNATSGTDYAPATSGSSILYGNGSGGFNNASVGTGLSFSAGTLACTVSGGAQIVQGTAQTTTSGTAYGYTGLPSWVKRITFQFVDVYNNSTTSGSNLVQLGSGSYTTTGYACTYSLTNLSTTGSGTEASGFNTYWGFSSTQKINGGQLVLTLQDSSTNTWVASGTITNTTASSTAAITGKVSLSGTLDRIRLTATSGSYAGGSVNIIYEG